MTAPADDYQKTPQKFSGISVSQGKEKSSFAESSDGTRQDKNPITEYTRNVDLEPEVEGWLEKLEKEDTKLQQPVTDQTTGQTVLDDSQQQKPGFKVVLPMTKDEVEKGLRHKIIDSVRWLAEWCIRMIKMFGVKVA
ncbi:MAG: hypothetical protein NTZ93_02375, partial [Candidatus Beckwithbacteria bacterium]|nr:hypothetical protein [Candidatus Beckwithbacteria bacterium]